MTSPQPAGIDGDPARTNPADGTGEFRPSQSRHPCRYPRSSIPALRVLAFPRFNDITTPATSNSGLQPPTNRIAQTRVTSLGQIAGREETRRNQRNEPNVSLDKICRFSGLSFWSPTTGAKRRNEPNVSLDKICRLCGCRAEQPLPRRKRRNEPIVKLGWFCGLNWISGFSGLRTPGWPRAGIRGSGRALACIPVQREARHGGITDSRAAKWSIKPKPGGAPPVRVERCGTNRRQRNLEVNLWQQEVCGKNSLHIPSAKPAPLPAILMYDRAQASWAWRSSRPSGIHSLTTVNRQLATAPMKILELSLQAFGPFTDVTLDLSGGREGLHLVCGPNEAGKSSALRALRQALFGFPPQSPDDFLHSYQKMRVGMRLRDGDGRELALVRRKGAKNTLLAADGSSPLPDAALANLLGGITEDEFSRRFALDHDELVAGGKSILEGAGELGQLLFQAGGGLKDLLQVQRTLDRELESLFKPSGTRPRINAGLAELKEARALVREGSLPSTEWVEHDAAHRRAAEQLEEVEGRLESARAERRRLERIADALPVLARLRQYQQDREALGPVVLLPDDFTEQRHQAIGQLESARAAEFDRGAGNRRARRPDRRPGRPRGLARRGRGHRTAPRRSARVPQGPGRPPRRAGPPPAHRGRGPRAARRAATRGGRGSGDGRVREYGRCRPRRPGRLARCGRYVPTDPDAEGDDLPAGRRAGPADRRAGAGRRAGRRAGRSARIRAGRARSDRTPGRPRAAGDRARAGAGPGRPGRPGRGGPRPARPGRRRGRAGPGPVAALVRPARRGGEPARAVGRDG